MKTIVSCLIVLMLASSALAAAPPPLPVAKAPASTQPDAAEVSTLLDQLGHWRYLVRHAATRKLIGMGQPVRPMLEAKLKEPDLAPETACRIRVVLHEMGRIIVKLNDQVSMEFVRIPAGKFLMGSPKDERGRLDNEGPQREVTISRPFDMGMYEVTQEQYEAVMGANPSQFKGPTNPVEHVTWGEAMAFCIEASAMTRKRFRLPTEAEWEYACRAGGQTRFCFGDDESELGNYAWVTGNSNNSTHPVGQKAANAFGLYDMLGNAGEWCFDWHGSYVGAPAKDPAGPRFGQARVCRGGSWVNNDPVFFRSAYRDVSPPEGIRGHIGFRVVVESE